MIPNNVNLICNNYNDFETLSGPWNNINTNLKNINSLNILLLNIRSINKNFEDLCIHIDNINIKFDMIVLTEAWLGLQDIDFNKFQIHSYSNYFTSRPKNQNDGVFIFIKNDIKNIQVTHLNLSSMSCLEISFLIDVGKLTIYAIYR
jgi:exonuclease III